MNGSVERQLTPTGPGMWESRSSGSASSARRPCSRRTANSCVRKNARASGAPAASAIRSDSRAIRSASSKCPLRCAATARQESAACEYSGWWSSCASACEPLVGAPGLARCRRARRGRRCASAARARRARPPPAAPRPRAPRRSPRAAPRRGRCRAARRGGPAARRRARPSSPAARAIATASAPRRAGRSPASASARCSASRASSRARSGPSVSPSAASASSSRPT